MAARYSQAPESVAALLALAAEPPSSALATCIRRTNAMLFSQKVTVDGVEKDWIDVLNATDHGVILLPVLLERCKHIGNTDRGTLMTAVLQFTRSVSSIVLCLLPDYTNSLPAFVLELAQKLNAPELALEPLHNLIQRYMAPGILTSLHKDLLRISLALRNFESAKPLLDIDIHDFDLRLAPVTYVDHLAYHYLAGVISALFKDYRRSTQFFEIVYTVSAPGHAISFIQVEAYKKLLLVQLLEFGHTKRLPKYTHVDLIQTSKHPILRPYVNFTAAFQDATVCNGNGVKVKKLAQLHRELFIKDRNWGLVQLCVISLSRQTLLSLSKVYSALPLSTLTTHLGFSRPSSPESVDQCSNLITKLIATTRQDDTLVISLDPQRGIVTLTTDLNAESGCNEDDVSRLDKWNEATRSLNDWQRQVEIMTRNVEEHRDYLTKVAKEVRDGGLAASSSLNANATAFGVLVDEDLEQNTGWEDDYGK